MWLIHFLAVLTISWQCVTTDVNGGPEVIGNYCVFWGERSRDYDNMVCAEFKDCYWKLAEENFLFNTPYYFSVSAVDLADNESEMSEEAMWIRSQIPLSGGARPRRMVWLPW